MFSILLASIANMSANIERMYSLVHGRRITVNHNKMTFLKKDHHTSPINTIFKRRISSSEALKPQSEQKPVSV